MFEDVISKQKKQLFANRNTVLLFELLLMLLIVAGFLLLSYHSAQNIQILAERSAQDAARMSSLDINSRLTAITAAERVASQTMANDVFLEQWAQAETEDVTSPEHQILYEYLKRYQQKYGYSVVFFVSAKTGNYYYQDGLNKKIEQGSEFDSWYYNFLALEQEYDIQVDRDEVNDYAVSIFVNVRVEDREGNFIGVVGVGNQIDDLQQKILDIESDTSSKIFIVNTQNAHNSYSGNTKFYKQPEEAAALLGVEADLVKMPEAPEGGKLVSMADRCVVIRSNHDLHWNVIAEKDTESLMDIFVERSRQGMLYLLMVLLPLMMFSYAVLSHMVKQVERYQNQDEVTGLMNNKFFQQEYRDFYRRHRQEGVVLFMVDVDDFKTYNDTKGHLFGNIVLKHVAQGLKNAIGKDGVVARWGGDEFIGIARLSPSEAKWRLDVLNESLQTAKNADMRISLSIGIAPANYAELTKVIGEADEALYRAKENGKSRAEVY